MPPLTSTSPVRKSVTDSEKVNVTVRSAVELIQSGTPLIANVGASASHSAVFETACVGPLFTPSVIAS